MERNKKSTETNVVEASGATPSQNTSKQSPGRTAQKSLRMSQGRPKTAWMQNMQQDLDSIGIKLDLSRAGVGKLFSTRAAV